MQLFITTQYQRALLFSNQYLSWQSSYRWRFAQIFTAMPPVAIGIFDQVAPEHTLLANPHLYKMPQSRAMFNVKVGRLIRHLDVN